jgi:hypothetical protein
MIERHQPICKIIGIIKDNQNCSNFLIKQDKIAITNAKIVKTKKKYKM